MSLGLMSGTWSSIMSTWQPKVDLSTLCPYTIRKIKKGNQMKTNKVTWIGDVRNGCDAAGVEFYGNVFNDRNATCRRLKFCARLDTDNGGDVSDEQLATIQSVIQARRPDLNVTVSRWESVNGWQGFGNVVVYYRPKVGLYMNHK